MKTRTIPKSIISYAYNLGNEVICNITDNNSIDIEVMFVDLKIKKICNTKYYKPGDILQYYLVITNQGNAKAKDVIISDEIHNLSYLENSVTLFYKNAYKTIVEPTVDNNMLNFEINCIEPNEVAILSYKTKIYDFVELNVPIETKAEVTNKANINTTSNQVIITQQFANIVSEKRTSKQKAYHNDDFEVIITITNNGNIKAENIVVTEKLFNNFILEEIEPIIMDNVPYLNYNYNETNHSLDIEISELEPNKELTIIIKGKVFLI